MSKPSECPDCGSTQAQRRRCRPCTRAHKAASDPDYAYEAWLTSVGNRDFVPNEQALMLIEAALAKHDTLVSMCEAARVQERRVYDVRNKGRGMEHASAAKVALEANMLAEFEEMTMRQFGRDEWSALGRFCGDGSPGMLTGCGTFAHASHSHGLCEECHDREVLGCGPMEPRDVRLAVTR